MAGTRASRFWAAAAIVAGAVVGPDVAWAADDDDDDNVEAGEDAPSEGATEKEDGTDEGWLESTFADAQADDWFTLARPVVDIDGYYRVRTNLFSNFDLGRVRSGGTTAPTLWPTPPSDSFTDLDGNPQSVLACGGPGQLEPCHSNTQGGANMRLRVEPSISVSDNVHVYAQLDMLDNVVLGSTPEGYVNAPAPGGGYQVVARGGYAPSGGFTNTTWAPQSGINSAQDAIVVKRAWGEYRSPIGKISFGRMANHWGLGMLFNGGDDYDADWQTNVDRLMFTYAFERLGLYLSAAWDFGASGPSSSVLHGETGEVGDDTELGANFFAEGPRFDLSNQDDLAQYTAMVVRKEHPSVARRKLARGLPVIATGAYFSYQTQLLANETTDADTGASLTQSPGNIQEGLVRRGFEAATGDLWFQLRYLGFRAEVEAAFIYGSLENTQREESDFQNLRDPLNDGWRIRQFGLALETEYRTLADRLGLGFDFGIASGDSDVANLEPTVSGSTDSSVERQLTGDRNYSTFRFNPNYRVDLILFRNLLTRVQGTHYFRPHVAYDFMRDPDGQRLGGEATVIYSRASTAVQAPGNSRDLGVEVDLKLLYQLSPGRAPSMGVREMGGFYTSLEYGVLFPLAGLDVLPGQERARVAATGGDTIGLSPAQMIRWYLGIFF
ncbi:MAG: TIGR04551 family protein [Myxococcota bacterium]